MSVELPDYAVANSTEVDETYDTTEGVQTTTDIENKSPEQQKDEIEVKPKKEIRLDTFLARLGFVESEAEEKTNHAPHLSLFELFKVFLWFGCRAFGGPVAQIQMMKQELVMKE
jgi:hypothetical protein